MCVCELSCRWTVFKCVSVNCLVGELPWFILVDVSIYRIWKQIYYKKSKIKVDQRDKIWCIHLFVRSFWISIMARTVSAKLCGQMLAWTHNLPQTYVRNSPPIGLKPKTFAEISPDIITCTFFTCTCRFNIPFEYFSTYHMTNTQAHQSLLCVYKHTQSSKHL